MSGYGVKLFDIGMGSADIPATEPMQDCCIVGEIPQNKQLFQGRQSRPKFECPLLSMAAADSLIDTCLGPFAKPIDSMIQSTMAVSQLATTRLDRTQARIVFRHISQTRCLAGFIAGCIRDRHGDSANPPAAEFIRRRNFIAPVARQFRLRVLGPRRTQFSRQNVECISRDFRRSANPYEPISAILFCPLGPDT